MLTYSVTTSLAMVGSLLLIWTLPKGQRNRSVSLMTPLVPSPLLDRGEGGGSRVRSLLECGDVSRQLFQRLPAALDGAELLDHQVAGFLRREGGGHRKEGLAVAVLEGDDRLHVLHGRFGAGAVAVGDTRR